MSEAISTRLNKYISDTGFCSRREADKLIEQGRVKVNGKLPELGTKVLEGDVVLIDDKPLNKVEKTVYMAFNKPAGIICTTERHIKGNIIDYIKHPMRIFPIGRLDRPSEGLIFLTNDGNIVNKILRAGNQHEKEYIVTVNRTIDRDFVQRMSNGLPILDTITKKCKVEKLGEREFRIILTQGLNRQIRRMCTYLGFEVRTLKRVRIMNITLSGLASGQWRYLGEEEMKVIFELVATSSKTEEASYLEDLDEE